VLLFATTYLRKADSIFLSPQLVNKETKETVAESHSHGRNSILGRPHETSLEISEVVSYAVDIVLFTFILVWSERQNERKKVVTEYATDRSL